jgi:transketolase
MRPPIRLAALMEQRVIYVFTHDSIGLGEDGPTHQPIEQLAALRAIPHILVIRPADATETAEAWKVAVSHKGGPVALVLTRQKLPVLDRAGAGSDAGVARGAYVLADAPEGKKPEAILLATGSEVQLAVEARDLLAKEGVAARVVSMPCWELFERQEAAYRDAVLPPDVTARVSVEAGAGFGWERYTGSRGRIVSMTRFGASAPYEILMKEFGFTPENLAAQARELVNTERGT